MFDFAVGDLIMTQSGEAMAGFLVQTPIQGLEAPDYRVTTYAKPGEHGGVASSGLYDSRPIGIPGNVWGNNPAEYQANRLKLSTACRLNNDNYGYPILTRISFTTMDRQRYFVDVIMGKPLFNHEKINNADFLITATAPDHLIYGATEKTSGAISRASGGGFILPVTLPIVSSAGSGGSALVNNAGNTATPPRIYLVGPLTNPYIYNSTNGQSMQLNYTIPGGSVVEIDMADKNILLNDSSSLEAYLVEGSNWFPLEDGDNKIVFNTAKTSDTGTMEIRYYDAWVGV